jgi:hypothetical protein
MTNDEGNLNAKIENGGGAVTWLFDIRASSFIRHSSFVLRH